MRPRVRLWVLLLVSLWPGFPVPAGAQDTETMRRELTEVRRQLDSVREQYERRLRELTNRLDQLESERRAATPAPGAAPSPTASGPAARPTATAPLTAPAAAHAPTVNEPTIGELLAPRQPFALAQPARCSSTSG